MSQPTQGERAFAARHGLDPGTVAHARDALNAIVLLPWPRTEQVSLVARLARKARADVGPVLAGLALNRAPITEFTALLPVNGLGEKRVLGLARALSTVDVAALSPEFAALQQAQNRVSALSLENAALRAEVDRLRLAMHTSTGPPPTTTMRLQEVASSLREQIVAADESVRTKMSGLRLGGVELRVQGTASTIGDDLALDISDPRGGSAVGLRFVPGGLADPAAAPIALIDVRGYGLALARRKLTAQGFTISVAKASESTEARGAVTDQSPAPGTLLPAGTVVRLVIS